MHKPTFILWLILIAASIACAAEVRKPAVSGIFYPEDKPALKKQVEDFLKNVPDKKLNGKLIGLIVPHAGYIYSGQVAAHAYKQLGDKKIDTVILIGSSHQVQFPGISIYHKGAYQTPLGQVLIDEDLAFDIMSENPKIAFLSSAHQKEHSLEVQLPFLQTVLKDFKIIPVIFGETSVENCTILKDAIVNNIKDKNVLLIASTDMSHYHDYEAAKEMDSLTLKTIEKGRVLDLYSKLSSRDIELCGAGAVMSVIMASQDLGADQIEVLKYANSGDVTENKDRVVGYSAIALLASGKKEGSKMLSQEQKDTLLKIARQTLESYIKNQKKPELKVTDPDLFENRGAFVTLEKQEKLRGCIGYVLALKPLAETVQENAINAAVNDPRFPPVSKDELKDIHIEISAMSPLSRIKDVSEIEVGKHGLYIKKGMSSGLLLPQVATDWNWNRDQFLENVCYKAGLSANAWKDKDAEIYIFSAEVFGE